MKNKEKEEQFSKKYHGISRNLRNFVGKITFLRLNQS
jgi:hypothetical protein